MSEEASTPGEPNPYAPPKAEGVPAAPAAPSGARDAGWVTSTYFAEGLPYSLVHQVVGQQYLTAVGADPIVLGLASLYHLPWNLKFIWSPLIDRVGTAKRWIVSLEVVLAALTAALAVPALMGNVPLVAWLLVPLAFVAATHDIAIDTYYMRALPNDRQSAMSGLRIGAYRGALYVGNGVLVTLAGLLGFPIAFVLGAAILVGLAVGHGLLLGNREEPATPEARAERLPFGVAELAAFFRKPGIVLALAFLLTFRAGDALMFAMSSKLLSDLGLDTTMRGIVAGGLGTTASIAGSILGGIVVAKGTVERTLAPIALLQSVAILLYAAMAALRPSLPVIAIIVGLEQLVAGIGTAAFVVFILRLSAGPHKATHFALGTALMSVGSLVSAVSGFILVRVGYPRFFLIAFAASLPGVALSFFVGPLVRRWASPPLAR
jgi:PAT family beta-lactamase induction signal transducer AmpG